MLTRGQWGDAWVAERPPKYWRPGGRDAAAGSSNRKSWSPDKGSWRGRDGNDPSIDIAKDADQRF